MKQLTVEEKKKEKKSPLESKEATLIWNYYNKYPRMSKKSIASFFKKSEVFVKSVIENNLIRKDSLQSIEFEKAVKIVEKYEGISINTIRSGSRSQEVVNAKRFLCALLCEKMEVFSLVKIGYYIGGLDHTTVIHHRNTNTDYCATIKNYRDRYNQMRSEFLVYSNECVGYIYRRENGFHVFCYKSADGKFYQRVSEDFLPTETFEPSFCVELTADEFNKEFEKLNL
jgi:hypothetical protein